jgi:hypothetical protein
MRTVGHRRILNPDEVPAMMEKLIHEPTSPEVLERRRKASAVIDKIRVEIGPIEEDIKSLIRRERGEEPIG